MEFDATRENFDEQVLKAATPVLVDFWAEWCMPCKMVEPVLADLAKEYDGRLAIARVNVDEQGELAAGHDIVSIPALLLFKEGTVVEQQVGAVPREILVQMIEKHLE
jgi:thioredoxin 1